jgi:hypothetical protein
MRAFVVIPLVFGIACCGSLSEAQTPVDGGPGDVLGAWELLSYKYGPATTPTDVSASKKSREVKLITKAHFIWVVYDLKKNAPTSSGGGTYSLVGNTYTERLNFATSRAAMLVGKEQSLRLTIEGDRMTEAGTLSDGTKIEEVWKKLQ